MRKLAVLSVLTLLSFRLLWTERAHSSANDEAQILQLLDRWVKAFQSRDLDGIMSIYEPGADLVAYDVVPPLQYTGFDAYKKDYQEFLDQFQGAIDVEFRGLNITAGDNVAFSRGLERVTGTL